MHNQDPKKFVRRYLRHLARKPLYLPSIRCGHLQVTFDVWLLDFRFTNNALRGLSDNDVLYIRLQYFMAKNLDGYRVTEVQFGTKHKTFRREFIKSDLERRIFRYFGKIPMDIRIYQVKSYNTYLTEI